MLLSVFSITLFIFSLEDGDDLSREEAVFASELGDGIPDIFLLGPEEVELAVEFARLLLFVSLEE